MTMWAVRLRRVVQNPLVVKDGLSRMRSWWAPVVIFIYLGMLVLFASLDFLVSLSTSNYSGQGYANAWESIFSVLTTVQFVLVCLFAPGVAAGAISGERERQTLDVLLVSGVSSVRIIWGKLVASVAFLLLLVLASLPLFATIFLYGGIDLGQFTIVQLLTVTTALTIGTFSLFLSTLFRRTLIATVSSYAFTFAATAGTGIVGSIMSALYAFWDHAGQSSSAVEAHPLLLMNPFYALFAEFTLAPAGMHVGRILQVLVFDTGPRSTFGPTLEPWQVTMMAQAVVVAACFGGAVRLLRAPRKPLRKHSEAATAGG